MEKIIDHLFVGSINEYLSNSQEYPAAVNLSGVLHRRIHPDLTNKSHCYVICERPNILSVNWVDSPDPKYFDYEGRGVDTILRIFNYLDRHDKDNVFIMCDQGISRSPAIAMAYLCNRDIIQMTYDQAVQDFRERHYPEFNPGDGINKFLKDNWEKIYELS